MTSDSDRPITIAFVGYTTPALGEQASAYEDTVLPLLADHGARLVYRGRRAEGQDPALPFEVHLLWFPSRGAYDAYLADDRRLELLEEFGDVFTLKQVIEADTISDFTG